MFHSIKKLAKNDSSSLTAPPKATKEQFLLEHNKLSPPVLQATQSMLSRFRVEKSAIFKDDSWPVDKIRRPFILWLTSLSVVEKAEIERSRKN